MKDRESLVCDGDPMRIEETDRVAETGIGLDSFENEEAAAKSILSRGW